MANLSNFDKKRLKSLKNAKRKEIAFITHKQTHTKEAELLSDDLWTLLNLVVKKLQKNVIQLTYIYFIIYKYIYKKFLQPLFIGFIIWGVEKKGGEWVKPMSRKSEIIANKRAKKMLWFYGRGVEWTKTKQKWVHYQSDDFIIIATQNVKCFKNGQWVLVVDNNKIVNLKDFQVRAIKNWAVKENAFAVRLTRQYFHVKTLPFNFTDTAFEKEQTWWDLVELAKVQDNEQLWWKDGHYDCLKNY